MKPIKQLSQLLANQIAAGEVVERPASVLKECLENSIDAGATQIRIEISGAGVSLLRITDNGCGISKDELILAVARHATSKIAELVDLEAVTSLGFRGEALASISSVSKLTLASRPNLQTEAWQIHLAGNDLQPQLRPTSHPAGTTVEVRDLFYNTPARRKFLRSEQIEQAHCETVIRQCALSHFAISFSLQRNNKEIFHLPSATTLSAKEHRISQLYGQNFLKHARKVEVTVDGWQLTGWLGMPTHTRSQADCQYVYVNQRFVRDRLLQHALRQAYADILPEGRFPLYILNLTCDPNAVDVNVHPTKHEVRFREARMAHDFLLSAVKQTLQSAQVPMQVQESVADYWVAPQQLTPKFATQENSTATLHPVRLLHSHYLLTQTSQQYALININRALQCLAETKWLQHECIQQPLLLPLTIRHTASAIKWVEDNHDLWQKLEIDCSLLSSDTLLIRALPSFLATVNLTHFFTESISQLSSQKILDFAAAVSILIANISAESDGFTTVHAQSLLLHECETTFTSQELLAKNIITMLTAEKLEALFAKSLAIH